MLRRFGISLRLLLNRPGIIFFGCMVFLVLSLVLDGNLWRLWGLQRDIEKKTDELVTIKENIRELDRNLKQAKDPAFIERQARDRLDLAAGNDLVFVFPEESSQ